MIRDDLNGLRLPVDNPLTLMLPPQIARLVFIRCTTYRGDVADHGLNYDYQLRRVLQRFKLKTIDVSDRVFLTRIQLNF